MDAAVVVLLAGAGMAYLYAFVVENVISWLLTLPATILFGFLFASAFRLIFR